MRQLNWLVQYTQSNMAVEVSMSSRKLQVASAEDMIKLIKLVEMTNSMVEVNMGRLDREVYKFRYILMHYFETWKGENLRSAI